MTRARGRARYLRERHSAIRDKVMHRLDIRHARFFELVGVSWRNGRMPQRIERFRSFPYIGSRYGEVSPRVLFVAQYDPTDEGHLVSFEERRRYIEDRALARHNPRSLLPPQYGWAAVADSSRACQSLLRGPLPAQARVANPLSFAGLTNWYKWVKAGGGAVRRHVARDAERTLLADEIRCYEPDIVIFQGKRFRGRSFRDLFRPLARDFDVRVWPHPSHRARRWPRDLVETLWP
ncbi:MAG: hypothetical protein OXI79_09510 [Gammaproteobacteria bacterium]|nr:hypothetical protein [Gammaproteobacteria bacterium]